MNSLELTQKLDEKREQQRKKAIEIGTLEREIDTATATTVKLLALPDGTQLKDVDFDKVIEEKQSEIAEKELEAETKLSTLEDKMKELSDLIG